MAALSIVHTFSSPDNNTTTTRNREVSFSSYLNKSEEAFIRQLAAESNLPNIHTKKKQTEAKEEEEIGVFSAEKYFNGGIDYDGDLIMTTAPRTARSNISQLKKKQEVVVVPPANLHSRSASLKSESSSWNSQSILLTKGRQNPDRKLGLLAGLATCSCYCVDKDSVDVIKEEQFGEISFRGNPGKKKPIPDDEQFVHQDFRKQRKEETCFSFPATTSASSGIIKLKTQPSEDEEGSDASSDLFEIESLTTASGKATPFLARQTSDVASGCVTPLYAPSEASVEWSVVTASACAADYLSVASDQEELRTADRAGKTPPSRRMRLLLMGCKSGEAVRVASDAAYVIKRERAKAEAAGVVAMGKSGFRGSDSFPRYRQNPHHRSFSPPNSRLVKVNDDLEFHR